MAGVYLDTSFISACVTTRTDPGSGYRREVSLHWWAYQAPRHDLFVSAEVVSELSAPGFPQRVKALGLIAGLRVLAIDAEVRGLAQVLAEHLVMPGPRGDALHVALATIYRLDYVLSWNVRHLANPNKVAHLRAVCQRLGLVPPEIVTPEALWEDDDG